MTTPILDVTNPGAAAAIGADLEQQLAGLITNTLIAVATVDDLEWAVTHRDTLAGMRRQVVEYFRPLKDLAFKLHRALCDREGAILKPLDAHDRAIRDAMARFKYDQDRIRQEAEAAEAARRRQELEAQAARDAADLEARGEPAIAHAVLEEAIAAPQPVVALPDVTRQAGAKFRKVWKWRYVGGPADVTTTPAAVMSRAIDLVPREFLRLDETKVGAYVRAMKSSAAIPGLEIYSIDEAVR